jgi:hypothetical protein
VDLTVAADGSLLIADFVYGHIWRVRYTGAGADAVPTVSGFVLPTASADTASPTPFVSGFVTSTPLP